MNKLKKVLKDKQIIWCDNQEYQYFNDHIGHWRSLISFNKYFIIIGVDSEVMPMELWIYDKNLNLIGGQDLFPDISFNGLRTFSSWASVPLKSKDILAYI